VAGQDRRGESDWHYQVEYEGKDNKKGGSWGRIRTYGGMLTENIVQAISRDLMVDAMFRVTFAGYPIILTVHDEIISERKMNTGGSGEEFNALMSELSSWAVGLPIAVAGYVGVRYRKD
jgi:DNA polymerase